MRHPGQLLSYLGEMVVSPATWSTKLPAPIKLSAFPSGRVCSWHGIWGLQSECSRRCRASFYFSLTKGCRTVIHRGHRARETRQGTLGFPHKANLNLITSPGTQDAKCSPLLKHLYAVINLRDSINMHRKSSCSLEILLLKNKIYAVFISPHFLALKNMQRTFSLPCWLFQRFQESNMTYLTVLERVLTLGTNLQ